MLTNFLYAIWFLLPGFFFVVALWAQLEKMSKSPKKQNPGDFLRQGIFLLLCAIVALGLDRYFVLPVLPNHLPSWMPISFVRILLLPVILLIGAKFFGGTKALSIGDPRQKKGQPRKY